MKKVLHDFEVINKIISNLVINNDFILYII